MTEEKEESNSMLIERFNLYLQHGFTVVSIAVNDEIGRVCVLRKSDFNRAEKGNDTTECANEEPYFLIEFYNANALPAMCFEKSTAIWDTPLECAVWLNNLVFVSCTNGCLILCSPFSTECKRFQICASPIGAMVALRETSQLLLGTDSSELLLVDCTGSQRELLKTSLEICSNIKLSNDERIVSMAAAKYHPSTVAIGMVNCIRIFDLASNKRTNIVIPKNTSSPTVIWSLVFVDEYLFSGDSRGNVSVYNSKSGALLKCITTHQSAVLALTTNGTLVFASGVDYRIQVIRGLPKPKDKIMDWTTVGQRIVHANDVRSLACVGEKWLLSGGAEHDVFITDAHMTLAFPILPRHSSITRGDDSCWILMRYPNHLVMWCRYRCDQLLQSKNGKLLDDVEIFNVTSETIGKPVKYARINLPSPNCHVLHAVMSPNATHFAFFSEMGLKVFVVNRVSKVCSSLFTKIWDSGEEILERWKSRHANDDDTMELDTESRTKLMVTAMLMTNDDLFFAESSYVVWRLRFQKKKSGNDSLEMFSKKEHGGNVIQLHANESCSTLIALNSNSQKSQVLKWCVHNENADDFSAEELPIDKTLVDMTFVSDTMLLLVCAELDYQVVFFDLNTNSAVKVLSKETLRIGFNQFLCYVSDAHDDQLVLVTNKSKVRTLSQLKEAKPLMHIKRKQKSAVQNGHDNLNRFSSSKPNQVTEFCRSEPSWGFRVPMLESTPVLSQRNGKKSRKSAVASVDSPPHSVLLVGHQPLAAPSQMPMKIKRYERN